MAEVLHNPLRRAIGGEVRDCDDFSLEGLMTFATETGDDLEAGGLLNTNELYVVELTEAPFLLGGMEKPGKLFVRNEVLYVAGLVERERQENGGGAVVVGNPGIGKSWSLLFFARLYLKAGRQVVFESAKVGVQWLLMPDGRVFVSARAMVSKLLREGAVHLFDCAQTASAAKIGAQASVYGMFLIVAASPNVNNFSGAIKDRCRLLYTDMWADGELRIAAGILRMTWEEVAPRIALAGGAPRIVLAKGYDWPRRQREALANLAEDHFALTNDGFVSGTSHLLVRLAPSPNRLSADIVPLTPKVGRLITEHRYRGDIDLLWKSIMNSHTHPGRKAYELEDFVSLFVFGTGHGVCQFAARVMGLSSFRTFEFNVDRVDNAVYNPLVEPLEWNVAYRPRMSNFPAADMFGVFDVTGGPPLVLGLQVTMNEKGHPLPLAGIKALLDRADELVGERTTLHVVFCVTPTVESRYSKAQALTVPSKASAKDVRSLRAYEDSVVQYSYVVSRRFVGGGDSAGTA